MCADLYGLIVYGCGMIRRVEDGLIADGLIVYGCGMISSVEDGLIADSLIPYGCGMIKSVEDALVALWFDCVWVWDDQER